MDAAALLKTKLFIPEPRRMGIPRQHLVRQLDDALHLEQQIILVSAAAGFGKTTLLAEWIQATRRAPAAAEFAWLGLDENDNDPTRFWTYVIAALQTAVPAIGASSLALLHSSPPPAAQVVLAALTNELAGLDVSLVLVLDDYHSITAQPIHAGLTFLLDHLPPQLYVVISTRTDPPLPLGRYRARGALCELRAENLRFGTAEALAFLNDAMGLELTPPQVAALEQRTEGWIAGLQLAALSVRGQQDVDAFIKAFTGSHRYVMDYLVDEVLVHATKALQNFLLCTSILEQFNAGLCDALFDDRAAASAARLDELERANLFLVPVDETRVWYRYHHLFAELLRHRLRQTPPVPVPELHLRASRWFEGQQFSDKAIEHALAAQAWDRSATLIERSAPAVFKRGEIATMEQWLDALPHETVQASPRLRIARARILLMSNQLEATRLELDSALKFLEHRAAAEQRALRGEIALLYTVVALYRNDAEGAAKWVQQALADLPAENVSGRGEATFWSGVQYMWGNDFAHALASFQAAVRLLAEAGDHSNHLYALINIGAAHFEQGKLSDAYRVFGTASELSDRHQLHKTLYVSGLHVIQCELYYEWNQLDLALQHARQAYQVAQMFNIPRGLAQTMGHLAETCYARGDRVGTLDLLAKIQALVRENEIPLHYTLSGQIVQVHVWLADGRVDLAVDWMRSNRELLERAPANARVTVDLLFALILLAQNDLASAEALLLALLDTTRLSGRTLYTLPVLLLLALLYQVSAREETAHGFLAHALALGEPEGFIRSFVDRGERMRVMLIAHRRRLGKVKHAARSDAARLGAFIEKLLAEFEPEHGAALAPAVASRGVEGMYEALTLRELQVLSLVAEGKSNQEIADRLHLSLSAIKKNTGMIYGKLAVSNRTEAVARARELGLVS